MDETRKSTGYSIKDAEKAYVDEIAKKLGISRSSALSVIISEHREMRKEYVTVPVKTRRE